MIRLKPEAVRMLRRVKRMILAEPKRMDMDTWKVERKDFDPTDPWDRSLLKNYDFPKCGMVGCIGGWVEILHRQDHPRSRASADAILGLKTVDNMFGELCFDVKLMADPVKQTMRHARRVAKHIDGFIEKYR